MNGSSPASEAARSEAMMEGTRMLIESLREKVAALEDRCEKMDREKVTDFSSVNAALSTLSTFAQVCCSADVYIRADTVNAQTPLASITYLLST